MSIKALTTQTMITISGSWLEPKNRSVLESMSMAKAMLNLIVGSHEQLLAAQRDDSATAEEIRKIYDEQLATDAVHDRKLRGIHGLLGAHADLTGDPHLAKTLLNTRDVLFPDGLKGAGRSYRDEAGEAQLVRRRITPEMRALLESLPVGGGCSVMNEVEAWLSAADHLGALEDKKDEAQRRSNNAGTAKGDAAKARADWIKMARTLQTVLDADPSATDEIRERLLSALVDAEAKADRRQPSGKETPPTPAPVPAKPQ